MRHAVPRPPVCMAVMRDEDRKTNEVLSILQIIQREQKHAQVKFLTQPQINKRYKTQSYCRVLKYTSVTKTCPYDSFFIQTMLNYDLS